MASDDAAPSTSRWRMAGIFLFLFAAISLAAGIALPFIANRVFNRKLAESLPISPKSVSYSAWLSGELRFQVWMWNVTNSQEVLADNSVTPHLSQVGPFTFKETRNREGVQFYDNSTVSYDDVRTYYFLPEESVGSMSDFSITNVNLPYIGVALRYKDKSLFARKMLQNYLSKGRGGNGGIFTTRTVEELLLGYEDVAMRGLSSLSRLMGPGPKVPSRFGIMLGKNATAKGSALVGTGSESLSDLNSIQLWNGQSSLSIWRQDWANRVVGTDGTMFPPPVTRDKALVVFTPDLCRSANMTYRRSDTVQGITVLAFSPAKTALMNSSGNPDNAAFCTPRCLDSGVLNLSLCLPGNPPIVASAPHFFGAPTYARMVAGIDPMAVGGRDFETRLEVEPYTGLLLRAARRMQINIALESVEGFPDTQRFGQLFLMPYLWLNESGSIGPEPAARFKQRVLGPMRLASLVSWLLVALGISLAIVALVVCCMALRIKARQRRSGGKNGSAAKKGESEVPLKRESPDETNGKRRLGAEEQQVKKMQDDRKPPDVEELLKSLPEPETPIV